MDPDEKASAALAALEHANFKSLMKATEDMVTKARLDQIARDHKSMGAILDDRVLYKIEEPKKRNKNQLFRSALQLQHDAELLEVQEANNAEKMRQDVQAAELLKKGSDYTVEQQIWKEKSGPAVYSQARRFQFPELQKFKERMSHEQHVQFRRRTNAALITLADKFRAECKEMKSDMDLNGVFHPEANAHRVHCIYLMKLYKGIRSDTIEDPILRQMKREEEQRAADLLALQAQKQELLRSMEAADMANLSHAQLESNAAAEAKRKAAESTTESDNKDTTLNDAASIENSLETGSMVAGSVATNSVANLAVQVSKVSLEKALTVTPGNRNSMVSFAQGAVLGTLSGKTSAGNSAKQSGVPTPKSAAATPKPSPAPTPKGGMVKKRSTFFEAQVDNRRDVKDQKADGVASSAGPGDSSVKESVPLNRSTSLSAMAGSSYKHSGPSSAKLSAVPDATGKTTLESSGNKASNAPNTNANAATPVLARRSSHTKSAPTLAPGGARRRLMSGISEDNAGGSQSTDRISSPEKEKNPLAHTREKDKLFKRIKTNKLGHAEAKTLLEEEASKLDLAESFSLKRTRDKNSILDTEMSDWMLSSVQKAQIGKTSTGTAMLTTGGLSQHLKLPASSIVTEFNDAIKKTSASPTKMLPFDTFHDMFSSYSQQHPSAATAVQVPSVAAAPPSSGTGKGNEEGSSVTGTVAKKGRRRRQTDGALGVQYNNETGSLVSSIDEDNNSRLTHRSKSSFLLPIETNNKAHSVEPTNLVKTLAEQDANFEAYLKLAEHQQNPNTATTDTQSKMRNKLNSSIAPPRRIRKANPLGQNAINLVDSRGRASKDSRRGFSNIFQSAHVSESLQEEETDEIESKSGRKSMLRMDSHVSIMGTDNIMGRLKRLDEDDASFPSITSLARSSTYETFSPDARNNTQSSNNISSSFLSPSSLTSSPGPTVDNEKSFRSSRNSRSRRRLQSYEAAASAKGPLLQDDEQDGEEGYIPAPDPDQSMQDKLVSAWDTLQMPAAQRFGFMHKYSTDANSVEMGRAVDMWSECALLVACVAELNRLLNKIKSGNCVMPLTKSSVLRAARSKISPLLASPSEQFIPPTMSFFHPGSVHQRVPLSAAALSKVHEIVEGMFAQHGKAIVSSGAGRRDFQVYDLADSQALMTKVVAEIAILLKKALKTVQTELDDVVPYGPRGCKEWIFGIAGLGKKNISTGTLDEFEES